jgi:hypothetical protein
MLVRCPICRECSPDQAAFCIGCGAALHVLAPPVRLPLSAIGPTVRLIGGRARQAPYRADARAWMAALPVAGLLFTVVFTLGLAHYLAISWSRPLGVWPAGVPVAGALVAQRAWLCGQLWRGVCDMTLWGGMIWLLAADLALPWGAALAGAWLLARLLGRLR